MDIMSENVYNMIYIINGFRTEIHLMSQIQYTFQ